MGVRKHNFYCVLLIRSQHMVAYTFHGCDCDSVTHSWATRLFADRPIVVFGVLYSFIPAAQASLPHKVYRVRVANAPSVYSCVTSIC